MQWKLLTSEMKILIDNIEAEAEPGQTLLDVARRAGIVIPTLCHKDGVEHYSSCMVCLVKDKARSTFIPSCSALVQDGMNIDASGAEVIAMRKRAVELLLSEHRAECEAPCRIVCPAAYNIPLINRFLAAGKTVEAIELAASEIRGEDLRCLTCPGYCENACRRKKIDAPISIKNIFLFVYQHIEKRDKEKVIAGEEDMAAPTTANALRKRYSSRIGRLDESEMKEWLKESSGNGSRYTEIEDFSAAGGEAENCMHCDCRASRDCRLRDMAEELSIKDPRGKIINSPIFKKISSNNGLIFENAKCIKCGLCVRVCEDSTDNPSLCFINRGFISVISEPLTNTFDDITERTADLCVKVCPTGALSYKNDKHI